MMLSKVAKSKSILPYIFIKIKVLHTLKHIQYAVPTAVSDAMKMWSDVNCKTMAEIRI